MAATKKGGGRVGVQQGGLRPKVAKNYKSSLDAAARYNAGASKKGGGKVRSGGKRGGNKEGGGGD